MRKWRELLDEKSCLNRAEPNELLFVLLARDRAAPVAIRAWVAERVRLGLNKPDDPQITEALATADRMVLEAFAGKVVSPQDTGYKVESGDWGWLPKEPCRFCMKTGGVVLFKSHEGKATDHQEMRCNECGKVWEV